MFEVAHAQNPCKVLLKRRMLHAQKLCKALLKNAEKGAQWLNGRKSADSPIKMLLADLFGVRIKMLETGFGLRGGARSKPS